MGLGNLLWQMKGLVFAPAERLYAHYHWPESVEIVDGRHAGTESAGYVEASHLLPLTPSTTGLSREPLQTYAGDKVPSYLSAKNESGIRTASEVLALADIRGHLPAHIALVGLQPVRWTTEWRQPDRHRARSAPGGRTGRALRNWSRALRQISDETALPGTMTACRWKTAKACVFRQYRRNAGEIINMLNDQPFSALWQRMLAGAGNR